MHAINVTANRVYCSCGHMHITSSYSEARRLAELHADKNRPAIIKPLQTN